MKPVFNLEETPGKVVSLMPRLPFPKGVFRLRTFEEADAWTEKHILQAALNKARAHPNGAT
jgi:hypothetical protein